MEILGMTVMAIPSHILVLFSLSLFLSKDFNLSQAKLK
nr:MAG TPA: hypothetical protein [Inoviridae sp.]